MLASTNAVRPPTNTSTWSMGAGSKAVNKAAASARLGMADSVIRSCSVAATWPSCSAVNLAVLSKPDFMVNRYSVKRSTRRRVKPQLCAMSVALEAQGETVPIRGLTTIRGPSTTPV